jgi:hypothetical protein
VVDDGINWRAIGHLETNHEWNQKITYNGTVVCNVAWTR